MQPILSSSSGNPRKRLGVPRSSALRMRHLLPWSSAATRLRATRLESTRTMCPSQPPSREAKPTRRKNQVGILLHYSPNEQQYSNKLDTFVPCFCFCFCFSCQKTNSSSQHSVFFIGPLDLLLSIASILSSFLLLLLLQPMMSSQR